MENNNQCMIQNRDNQRQKPAHSPAPGRSSSPALSSAPARSSVPMLSPENEERDDDLWLPHEKDCLRIKDMPEEDRPMEKLMRLGVKALSDEELAAILIGTGTKRKSALELASSLLRTGQPKAGLLQATVEELMHIDGIGRTKASRILAGVQLGKRLSEEQAFFSITLANPQSIANYFRTYYAEEQREHFCVILVNAKLKPIRTVLISIGSLTQARVHPREVFQPAVRIGCAGVVLSHNHPSGDPEPSPQDIAITRRLVDCGKLLGIEVYDHVIVGKARYVSLRERHLM